MVYRFGKFMLDTANRTLLSGSSATQLSEKLFQTLVLLLESNGRIVSRDAFFERVWPDEDVTDANLTQQIFMLRRLLEDTAGNSYVVTVARKGYRLTRPVETKHGLTMKESCERCGAVLAPPDDAFICSYECTFCPQCAGELRNACPNCAGDLLPRPHRKSS